MAICTETGIVYNDEDMGTFDVEKAKVENPELVVPKGKMRKPDGSVKNLTKKV